MTRIATLAASEQLLSIMARTQERVQELETQVATGKRAQTYAGIPDNARRLLDLEARKQVLDRFQQNNTVMKTRLDMTSTTLDGLSQTIRGFRQELLTIVSSKTPLTAEQAGELQEAAFRAMQSVETLLNTDVDGRYLFAGSRVRTAPVSLPAATLADFQATWDGDKVIYPPTRQAQVEHRGVLTHAATGDLTIEQSAGGGPFDTIRAANDRAFAGLQPGATITIADSSTGNPGTYTVVTSDSDKRITIAGTLTFPGTTTSILVTNALNDPVGALDTTASITIGNWFQGDTRVQTHRVDEDRSLSLDLDAIDPAFEKAMRALGILAQGAVGTPGGLDAHDERVDQAMFLLNDAIEPGASGTPPFGTERAGSLDDVATELGFQQVMLDESSTLHRHLMGLWDDRIAGLENADTTEAIALLLEGTRSLEASYQAIARVRQLSLAQFL